MAFLLSVGFVLKGRSLYRPFSLLFCDIYKQYPDNSALWQIRLRVWKVRAWSSTDPWLLTGHVNLPGCLANQCGISWQSWHAHPVLRQVPSWARAQTQVPEDRHWSLPRKPLTAAKLWGSHVLPGRTVDKLCSHTVKNKVALKQINYRYVLSCYPRGQSQKNMCHKILFREAHIGVTITSKRQRAN